MSLSREKDLIRASPPEGERPAPQAPGEGEAAMVPDPSPRPSPRFAGRGGEIR
jgi:hypothetical protein